ncbi:MAG: hypothetical protein AAGD33_03640 [Actinomycetota bacterium]
MTRTEDAAAAPPEPALAAMLPYRIAAVVGLTGVVVMSGFQVERLVGGESRNTLLMWGPLVGLLVTALATLLWTYNVVANVRRLTMGRATVAPLEAASSWALPFLVAAGAAVSVFALQVHLEGSSREQSPLPLAIALVALIVTMLVAYRPVGVIAQVMRQLGGMSIRLARWYWVPVLLAVVGTASLFAMSALGLFDDALADGARGVDGLVPLWALGVVAIPPSLVVIGLAWSGASSVEFSVNHAHDRRLGRARSGVGRGRVGLMTRALRADARPPIARDRRKTIRLVPGADLLRGALVALTAALVLVSIVGALVMFLFWQESRDGVVLPGQRTRAWDALAALRDVEQILALGLVGVAVVWTLVVVFNVRLSTGRRRNPLIAAASWPAAAWVVITLARRIDDDTSGSELLLIFGGQILAIAVPFFLLSRSALTVGAQIGPIRVVGALVAVLVVHLQGLGGLSTIGVESDLARFGPLAGYLALAALLELLAVIAVSESSRVLVDGARAERDKHNFLVDQANALASQRGAPTPVEMPWSSDTPYFGGGPTSSATSTDTSDQQTPPASSVPSPPSPSGVFAPPTPGAAVGAVATVAPVAHDEAISDSTTSTATSTQAATPNGDGSEPLPPPTPGA